MYIATSFHFTDTYCIISYVYLPPQIQKGASNLLKLLRFVPDKPILLVSQWNPIFHYGVSHTQSPSSRRCNLLQLVEWIVVLLGAVVNKLLKHAYFKHPRERGVHNCFSSSVTLKPPARRLTMKELVDPFTGEWL
ncbi:hypothetical protein PAECIP111891_02127 [Paenibacillus allorhizoplanae]|uniref:Transposase n=1 Tax=Paenibacillus allorhizoplanae TaxID=2905648 RepID=A0ABN8G882_9BACL|nr:hypothetical protein PAECIP111891_02127 [Paenibacillus allorhizoplanae]